MFLDYFQKCYYDYNFWQSLGSPKNFNLVELGAGNGEMMKILIESFKNFPVF